MPCSANTFRRLTPPSATKCPTCGQRQGQHRRLRAEPATPPPLPLFAWAAANAAPAAPRSRLILLETCLDADGQPRPALLIPGRRVPLAFRTMAAALAAQRVMEAGR